MADSFKIQSVQGTLGDATALETVAEALVAFDLTPSDATDVTNFLFSENAEDNGTAGTLDLDDGLIYDGPPGNYVQVDVIECDIIEGSSAPSDVDEVAPVVIINSTLFAVMNTADSRRLTGGLGTEKVEANEETKGSGFVAEIDTGILVEFNYSGMVGPLSSGDVIRFGLLSGNEETSDWDNSEGTTCSWSIS